MGHHASSQFYMSRKASYEDVKWINGNCIKPSHSLDWLVLHNAHEKQVALLSGYVQNTPDSFGRNDKWKCLSAPGFYLELHAPVIKINPAGKIFINNNDDQMNCSSVIFSYFWDHNFRNLFFVTRVGKIISLREPPFTVLGTNRTPKCFQFLNRSRKA